MSKHSQPISEDFIDWLDEIVEASLEAKQAAREEELRLHLAGALRKAREASGMTQALVAEVSTLKQSMVSRLERADHNPTVETILKYLNAVSADLVLSVIVDGQMFAATETAQRAVVLPQHISDEAEERGVSLREHVIGCVTRQQTMRDVASVFREELHREMVEMRSWMRGQQDSDFQTHDVGSYVSEATYGSEPYSVAA